jgi:hypothetical protein
MANPLVWPFNILAPRGFNAVKLFANTKGNPSINGITQSVASYAGRWKIEATGFVLGTATKIKVWRAIESLASGQAGQFIVPLYEVDRTPIQGDVIPRPHSDGTYFSDGAGYISLLYSASVSAAVALHSTVMVIDHTGQSAPEPGQMFSAGVRLYSIGRIIESTSTTVTVSIWPPTREAITAGMDLNFDTPQCLCRLASDDELGMKELDMARWGAADVTWIEDTGPVLT